MIPVKKEVAFPNGYLFGVTDGWTNVISELSACLSSVWGNLGLGLSQVFAIFYFSRAERYLEDLNASKDRVKILAG